MRPILSISLISQKPRTRKVSLTSGRTRHPLCLAPSCIYPISAPGPSVDTPCHDLPTLARLTTSRGVSCTGQGSIADFQPDKIALSACMSLIAACASSLDTRPQRGTSLSCMTVSRHKGPGKEPRSGRNDGASSLLYARIAISSW